MSHKENMETYNHLIDMGFPPTQVNEALTLSSGNVHDALNYLLSSSDDAASGGGAFGATSSAATTSNSTTAAGSKDPPGDLLSAESTRAGKSGRIITCPVSQYNFEEGRSACTCIALTGAREFFSLVQRLQKQQNNSKQQEDSDLQSITTKGTETNTVATAGTGAAAASAGGTAATTTAAATAAGTAATTISTATTTANLTNTNDSDATTATPNTRTILRLESLITAEFLQDVMFQGVHIYEKLQVKCRNTSGSANSFEHMSVEEVLLLSGDQEKFFASLQVAAGGIRQGILGGQEENSLRTLLQQCRQQEGNPQEWMVVVMTKTPETILMCLPPTTGDNNHYIVIDSHPRPGVIKPRKKPDNENLGSYARIHSSLETMCQFLETIFPVTDLGPDVPEMMSIMYNSFDLYPLLMKDNSNSINTKS